MTLPVLKVAVIGHTNTGKTSLLRTLTRDVSFGDVSSRPATTRVVEASTLFIDDAPAVELIDTPGLESSTELHDHLDALRRSRGSDWTDAILFFLDDPREHGEFPQEAKALRQVIDCDVALYVIDARDRVLGKHRDELDILGRCARPICHVIGDYNKYGGIDSTPSFQLMARRDDVDERMRTFYARPPHPVFVRVPGVPRRSNSPAYASEFAVSPGDIENLLAFIQTLKNWRRR